MVRKKISELAKQIRGVSYKPNDLHSSLDDNSVILLRANNIDNGEINFDDVVYVDKHKVSGEQYLQKGDILICASSGSKQLVGKAATFDFPEECTFGAFCKVVRPQKSVANYLATYFQSSIYRRKISEVALGASINNIRNEHIDNLEIPVGTDAENEIVVHYISLIQSIINNRRQELKKLDEFVKARFVEMFGDLVENTKHFPIRRLNEISSYWNGLTYKPTDVADDEAGTLVLRSSNIQKGMLSFGDNVYVNCKIKAKYFVCDNDILMCSRNGSAALVGKTALIKGLQEATTFGAFMMVVRSEYYAYLKTYFEMPCFRSQLSTGTSTINQITGKMLNEISLPVPDIEIVRDFEKYTQLVDKSKVVVQRQIKDLQELFDKKMEEYFGRNDSCD